MHCGSVALFSTVQYKYVSSEKSAWCIVFDAMLSLGVPETVKFVARHTKPCDLLRIFNLGRALSHLGGKTLKIVFSHQVWHSGAESGLRVLAIIQI